MKGLEVAELWSLDPSLLENLRPYALVFVGVSASALPLNRLAHAERRFSGCSCLNGETLHRRPDVSLSKRFPTVKIDVVLVLEHQFKVNPRRHWANTILLDKSSTTRGKLSSPARDAQ